MKEIRKLEMRQVGTASDGRPIRKMFYEFECEYCHNTFERTRSKGKASKSCRECFLKYLNPSKSHDMSGTRAYHVWRAMKQRCDNPNNDKYHRYGGRGITYDPKWKDFKGFWEDMHDGYSDNLTIDRKDNDGNYTKDNCRWIEGWDNSSRSKLKKVYKLKPAFVLVESYESGNEAEHETGILAQSISNTVCGRQQLAGGYKWVNESGLEKLKEKYDVIDKEML